MLLAGIDEALALTRQIQDRFIAGNLSLATAESCTGGLLASLFTHFPGSSQFYLGGVSAYSNSAKARLLEVDPQLIEEKGAVSAEVAQGMAAGALRIFNADYGISVTGIAGPGGATPTKPVGTIYLGFASRKQTKSILYSLKEDRLGNRSTIVTLALSGLLEFC